MPKNNSFRCIYNKTSHGAPQMCTFLGVNLKKDKKKNQKYIHCSNVSSDIRLETMNIH